MKQMIAVAGTLIADRISGHSEPVSAHTAKRPVCTLYRAVNGRPGQNLQKIVEMMGGIEKIAGPDDIVIIKPNVQWWNQGAPNLQAIKMFVDMIMNRSGGFEGEVVLMENSHRGKTPWHSHTSGWTPVFHINSDLPSVNNYNELSDSLKKQYRDRFSTIHLIDVDKGGCRVFSPADGAGYVYCDGRGGVPLVCLENGAKGKNKRVVIMTYPILKTDRGTIVDFKNGVWKNGDYTDQPLRFINFAALNHHSTYCGTTSTIKNYLGIVDLSGGADPHTNGKLTENFYNFHSFPFDCWASGPVPGMLGAQIGIFMNTIRKADLNVVTAEWIGMASRTEPPIAHTRAVLASTDPVALDYHSAKYLLYPNSRIPIHNPDNPKGPLNHYLRACAETSGCVLDESRVAISSWDYNVRCFQARKDLIIKAKRLWGDNIKMLLKYGLLRWI